MPAPGECEMARPVREACLVRLGTRLLKNWTHHIRLCHHSIQLSQYDDGKNAEYHVGRHAQRRRRHDGLPNCLRRERVSQGGITDNGSLRYAVSLRLPPNSEIPKLPPNSAMAYRRPKQSVTETSSAGKSYACFMASNCAVKKHTEHFIYQSAVMSRLSSTLGHHPQLLMIMNE